MATTNTPISSQSEVIIRVSGDLMLRGREGKEILARADSSAMRVECDAETCRVTCVSDCNLLIPLDIKVKIEKVGGDATISELKKPLIIEKIVGELHILDIQGCNVQNVGGDLRAFSIHGSTNIQRVGGDLDMQFIEGDLNIGFVGGDLLVDNVSGAMTLDEAGGDASIRKIKGAIECQRIGGDLNLQVGAFPLQALARGDLKAGLNESGSQTISLKASGDLSFFFPDPNISAELNLRSGQSKIELRFNGKRETIEEEDYNLTLGEGSMKIHLDAQGEVRISDEPWISPHFDRRFEKLSHQGVEKVVELSEVWHDFDERISRSVEKAAQRAQAAAERAELRVQAAMDRVNQRIGMHRTERFSWGVSDPPAHNKGSVTDNERILILKMLQEKKITVEEAEKLLQTLEGLH